MICGSVSELCCSSEGFIVNIKRIGAEAAVVSALAFTAFGISAGIASADQPLPSTPGMTWKLDHGHGHTRAMRRRILGAACGLAVGPARSVGVLMRAS
jgi:hypothetical protein